MSVLRSVRSLSVALAAVLVVCAFLAATPGIAAAAVDITPPASTTRLVFVHHSTGEAWLQDSYGNLAAELGANNYFVSDTNYGWGPDGIGDRTDIGHWWTWFRGPSALTYTGALYANTDIKSSYARSLSDPGGDNTVVMFKSCFPNSAIDGSPGDAVPAIGSNPLKGNSGPLTVGNVKGVYLDLLEYFKTQPDRLFVLVVSPPLVESATDVTQAANARYLADWLVDPGGYLNGYTAGNVFVFDYYTVLTGGHHRVVGGAVEHSSGPSNYLQFPTGDSHPSASGDQLATSEFVPMLNAAFNAWKAGVVPPVTYSITPSAGVHGSISPSTVQTVTVGAAATFTITPDTGYHIYDVLVDGTSVGAVASHTFTNVAENHTISATFALDPPGTYTLTYTAGPGGSIVGSSTQTVDSGDSGTEVIATPDPGYHFVGWSDLILTARRTDTNVTASKTVNAIFAADAAGTAAVYRFLNKKSGVHFYTATESEMNFVKDTLSSTYTYEGIAYRVAPTATAGAIPVYRFLSKKLPYVHFYTATEAEMTNVKNTMTADWGYEGVAYHVWPAASGTLTPVWRFFKPKQAVHFYTATESEMTNVKNTMTADYTYEGTAYYVEPYVAP